MTAAPFCDDCPDHEGCMTGYPCGLVKELHQERHDDQASTDPWEPT